MRVIAGRFKGRTLVAPEQDARPTLDRMKETLFNILNFRLQDAAVLDLFAGSGQLAIESLSRGAKRAVLCDCGRDAVNAIKRNFDKIGQKAEIYKCDYALCLSKLDCQFDVVFIDPPYQSGYYVNALTLIDKRQLLSTDGIIVCEHSAEDDLPSVVGSLQIYDSRKMGTVQFDFYRRSELCE